MKTFKTIFGYAWAGLGIPVIVATFLGMDFWEQKLFVEPGIKVNARWTGGEVAQTIDHDQYKTLIHRPVFDGLFWEKRTGFVQIDWQAVQNLPERIDESIDFDGDGQDDLQVILNTQTNEATLTPFDSRAQSFSEDGVLIFENARAVRVVLKKNGRSSR